MCVFSSGLTELLYINSMCRIFGLNSSLWFTKLIHRACELAEEFHTDAFGDIFTVARSSNTDVLCQTALFTSTLKTLVFLEKCDLSSVQF